jgi:hypothetical protein
VEAAVAAQALAIKQEPEATAQQLSAFTFEE